MYFTFFSPYRENYRGIICFILFILFNTASSGRPSDYIVSEDAGRKPGAVATLALQSDAVTTWLDLIHREHCIFSVDKFLPSG